MEELTHSQLLRRKISVFSARLNEASARFWQHPELVRHYGTYLCANHSVVRSSVPLMRAALTCALARADEEPAAAQLAAYLAKHIPEEMHHDDWLLEDLEAIGVPRAAAVNRMPSAAAARLAGAQYFWMYHYHPIAIAGYIAVLEGNPPEMESIREASERTGLPLQAFSNLTYHARLDPGHREDLNRALDGMALTAEHHAAMGASAIHTIAALTELMEEIFRMSGPRAEPPAEGFRPMAATFY